MPIKGMTDQQAALPIIGILRKGEAKNGNAPGKDLTYFRWVSDDADATTLFNQAYPDEEAKRNINVLLPYKTTDENMDSWIEKWVAGGLVYRSDSETVVLWRTDKGGYSTDPKPDPKPEIGEDGKRADGSCQVGRLSAIIPELGRLVTVTILTTSKNDIINLTKQLRIIEAWKGDLRGIPFVVCRRPNKISTPSGNGKRVRREKWLLSIETQPEYTRLQLKAMQREALPETIDADSEVIEIEDEADEIHELPANIIDPFEHEKTFDTPEDLFYDLYQEFGIAKDEAKKIAKKCGFTVFKASESGKMHQAIRQHLQDAQTAADTDLANQEADAILGQQELIPNGGNNYATEEA